MPTRKLALTMALLAAGAGLATGCQSNKPPSNVPLSYFEGTTLDRNEITVRSQSEYIEVSMNPLDTQLRLPEIAKMKAFFADYHARGHGPLMMSVPKGAVNPELAVEAVVEARAIAWEAGIEYTQIAGSAYEARGRTDAPLILAFNAYEAVAPDCPSLSQIDFSNATSNSDLPTLGCAVRTNMAAMIADPGDLLGLRPLEDGDVMRRADQLEKWRTGAATAAERTDSESGAISSAVN